jgi:N-acetyl sugar amidotransferase
MKNHCKKCLYSINHPLGLVIDEEGICSGCRVHEEKDVLDWNNRWSQLKSLITPYKSLSRKNYDCIIPVSGGGDSYYTVHLAKNKLGLNPLLVAYNKYFNTPLGIRNLANLRIQFDCDILIQNVNPNSVKKITKSTLRKFGSMYWPVIAGQTVFPVQTAVRYKIPLIIWGAHQGLEQVGMFSHTHDVEMTRRYRKDHDLMGHEADDLLTLFDSLGEGDIWQYRYPDDGDIEKIGVRGIYLGNYVRWDPRRHHEDMIKKYQYLSSSFSRTFDCYDHVDCYNYMGIHDYVKYLKHGYSRVTDHAVREIRHGRLAREHAKRLVHFYERKKTNYVNNFCEWLGVNERGLHFVLDQHRNKQVWKLDDERNWILINDDAYCINDLNQDFSRGYIANSCLDYDQQQGYITIGKGFP